MASALLASPRKTILPPRLAHRLEELRVDDRARESLAHRVVEQQRAAARGRRRPQPTARARLAQELQREHDVPEWTPGAAGAGSSPRRRRPASDAVEEADAPTATRASV